MIYMYILCISSSIVARVQVILERSIALPGVVSILSWAVIGIT